MYIQCIFDSTMHSIFFIASFYIEIHGLQNEFIVIVSNVNTILNSFICFVLLLFFLFLYFIKFNKYRVYILNKKIK